MTQFTGFIGHPAYTALLAAKHQCPLAPCYTELMVAKGGETS